MSRVFSTGGNFLRYTGTMGVTASPVTMFAWYRRIPTSAGYWATITKYKNVPGSAELALQVTSGDNAAFGCSQSGGYARAETGGAWTANVWIPIVGVYRADNTLQCYALSETPTAGSVGAFTAEASPVFEVGDGGTDNTEGKIAHVAIWSSALSAGNITSLLGGADPSTISSGTLIEYWALTGSSLVGLNGRTLSVVGTVPSDSGDNPTVGAAPATLSSPTPSGTLGTQTTATLGASTNQSSGTLYAVASATQAHITGITAAQVIAGQNSSSAAASFAANAAVSTASPSVGLTGLSGATLYYYALAQVTSGGNSNVVTGSFTTASNTRSTTITLYNASNAVLASTNVRVWTRTGLSAAAADGGTNGLALTTNGSGVLSVTNLTIAGGAGWLTVKDDTDDNNCHNYPVTFS